MRIGKLAAAAAIALTLFAPASSQDLGDEVTIVEELIVRPFAPGPAWWRVSDEDSAIWVMVVPQHSPSGLEWGREEMEFRMQGANRFIVPPEPELGPIALARGLFMVGDIIESEDIEQRLSPKLRDRFVAVREQIGDPAEGYSSLSIDMAASKLSSSYLVHAGLEQNAVFAAFDAAARRHRVRKISGASFPGRQLIGAVDMSRSIGEPCLAAALDQLETRAAAQRAIAESWAEGDIRPLVRPPRQAFLPAACSTGPIDPEARRRLADRLRRDQAASFERALRLQGHSVAILTPADAFSSNGVLERLRAKGYVIFTPADQD